MSLLGYACHFRVCMDVNFRVCMHAIFRVCMHATFRYISKIVARRVEKNTLETQVENSNLGCNPQWQDV